MEEIPKDITYRYSFNSKELAEKLGIKLGRLSHANIGESSGLLWLDVTVEPEQQNSAEVDSE